jgi:pyrophosphatase PpaX
MMIKTILFDFDGTLIDTNELIYHSFDYTFKKFGYSFTKEEILQFNGPPLRETFSQLNPDLAEEMIRTYRIHNAQHHEAYVKLFPNVKETLEVLREKGFELGVVTAKMREGVKQGMEITGIESYFDTIVTIDDVENPKPHPEPVIKALNKLNAEADTAIMIGDNYHDIIAGNKAGTKTAGVSWSLRGKEYLKQFNPTYMLEDMSDLLAIVGV